MTRLQRIEQIAAKRGNAFTEAERLYIVRTSQALGVEFVPRPHCPDCYSDQAMLLRRFLKNKQAKQSESKYVLRDGCDVVFCGYRINNDTLTDALARKLIGMGFNKKFFIKCE